MGSTIWTMLLLTAVTAGPQEAPDDRLYGRVVTAAGNVHEGWLRWDPNEGSWTHVLDGSKEMPWQNLRDAERLDPDRAARAARDRSVDLLGLRISWDEDEGPGYPRLATAGVRFGHVRRLVVYSDDRARIELRSGEEMVLHGASTDLGDDLRELVVEDPRGGRVELRWRDLDEVEFMDPPRGTPPPADARLHGTLTTRRGLAFTGFISWDVDEILGSDVLDGDQAGEDRELPFHRIASIEPDGPDGARVVLVDGEELLLRGSNDVDHRNRGIGVADPALGMVTVGWDELESVRFHPAGEGSGGRARFTGGHPLWGQVEAATGEVLVGWLRWDNDEAWSWELLDGEQDGVDFDVELGMVDRIARLGSWGAEVTLLDGRTFELEGSNDVDDGNKGIYVTPDGGETVRVPWSELRRVVFQHP